MDDEIRNEETEIQEEPVFEEESSEVTEEAKAEVPAEETPAVNGKKGKKVKKQLTPEQKKKKRKKALIITASVVMVIALFFSVCAITNTVGFNKLINYGSTFEKVEYDAGTQLVPLKDTDGYWTFTTDRDFKVVQITDVHIGGGCFSQKKDKWALDAVATMIRAEKPDLVVVTGDIAYPVPFQAGTFNNLNATKIFSNMMENLGVYWTFTYGNHDTEAYSMYTRNDICTYYEQANFKYCLFQRGFSDEEKGYGNTIIKVKNSDGVVTQAITTLDSHTYVNGDVLGILWKYANIHQSQVDWFVQEMNRIDAANKAIKSDAADLKSIAFFHIPLPEYREAWKEYLENGYNSTANTEYIYGKVGEDEESVSNGNKTYGVFCGIGDDTLFEQGYDAGLRGVFCGHDHYNHFALNYTKDGKTIKLTYGMSIDFLAYAPINHEHPQRGCTVITVKPDTTFESVQKNLYISYGAPAENGSLDDLSDFK
ncbi:MAG: metallophosphoesterase [Clostridia bacterium]|nr:metallophosphoesterase [Clostridia bacterium]